MAKEIVHRIIIQDKDTGRIAEKETLHDIADFMYRNKMLATSDIEPYGIVMCNSFTMDEREAYEEELTILSDKFPNVIIFSYKYCYKDDYTPDYEFQMKVVYEAGEVVGVYRKSSPFDDWKEVY